jgi:hypothetical protein
MGRQPSTLSRVSVTNAVLPVVTPCAGVLLVGASTGAVLYHCSRVVRHALIADANVAMRVLVAVLASGSNVLVTWDKLALTLFILSTVVRSKESFDFIPLQTV